MVRQTDRADESFVRESGHRAPRLVQRYAGLVGRMKEVDVEVLAAEALKTRHARRADLVGTEAAAPRLRRDLRCDEHLRAAQRRAYQCLVLRLVVALGG